jgi:AcrR family transcriptional regulator
VPRPTRQQIDDEILDVAATLFARHGFKETSVQRIADAVGYSKTGLLHRFPTKEALQEAVLQRCVEDIRTVTASVLGHRPGPDRDRAGRVAVAERPVRRRGFGAVIHGIYSYVESLGAAGPLGRIAAAVLEAFAVGAESDFPRRLRVAGALGALCVARLAFHDHTSDEVRGHLVALSTDALGH